MSWSISSTAVRYVVTRKLHNPQRWKRLHREEVCSAPPHSPSPTLHHQDPQSPGTSLSGREPQRARPHLPRYSRDLSQHPRSPNEKRSVNMTIAAQHYVETFRFKQTPAALANATGLSVEEVESYLSSFPPPRTTAEDRVRQPGSQSEPVSLRQPERVCEQVRTARLPGGGRRRNSLSLQPVVGDLRPGLGPQAVRHQRVQVCSARTASRINSRQTVRATISSSDRPQR
jgi:hypothetical protein